MERIPEDEAGTMPEPDAESPPKPHAGIQPEPDTDELLQQYGAEYDDEETLESRHPPKPAPSGKPAGKKPVSVPPEPQRQSVDDALFFPDKDRVAAKPAKTTAAIVRVGIAVMLIAAGMYFIGLPVLKNYQSGTDNIPVSGNTTTPVPTVTIPTATPTRTSHSLVPLPTQTIPSGQVTFYVQKHPVTSKITVIFTGSSGKDGISYAIVTVTHPDGSVTAGSILPLKGVNEVMVDGSKDTDRVEIIAMMSDGKTYRVYDDLVPP